MNKIDWNDFKKVEIRVGTIIEVNDFPEAIKPAYQLKVNLGKKIGIKQLVFGNLFHLIQRQILIKKLLLKVVILFHK